MKNKKTALIAAIFASAAIALLSACDEKNHEELSVEKAKICEINIDENVRDDGLRIDRVLLGNAKNTATIYARFSKNFAANVILKAFDRTGNEIGRAKNKIAGTPDDAAYFDFAYDERVPLKSVCYFVLSFPKNLKMQESVFEQTQKNENSAQENAVPEEEISSSEEDENVVPEGEISQ